MPFDVGDFPGASSSDRAASRRSRRLVGTWLFAVAGMVLVMIGLGGATRLSGSGLSIMEWAPLMGTLPPLTEAEWQRLFTLYKQIPQFALVNADFGLADFKGIFWLEWFHRFWGRALGLAFLVPFVWFWAKGHIAQRLVPRLLALFVLGGLQGAVGWFMVASGFFPDATTVSAYRLVIHLGLALVLYGAILWTALNVALGPPMAARAVQRTHMLTATTCGLVAITILAGGFVAGIRAGLTYNTFPLMDGQLVPAGYGDLRPFILNFTENVAAVQFNHRLLASITAICALVTVVVGLRVSPQLLPRPVLYALGAAVIGQYVLGVVTLLHVVPLGLGTAHQVGAVLVLTAALVLLHTTRVPRARGGPE